MQYDRWGHPLPEYDWSGNPVNKAPVSTPMSQAAAYAREVEQLQQQAAQGQSLAETQFRKNLIEANRQLASQATARGANPLAERGAMYAGERNIAQGEAQAADVRQQELARLAALRQGAISQQIGAGFQERQMTEAERQARELERFRQEQLDFQKTQAGIDAAMGVVNAVGGVAGMMSDVNNKMAIAPAGYSDEDFRKVLGSYKFGQPVPKSSLERQIEDIDRQVALENTIQELENRTALYGSSKTWQPPSEELMAEYGAAPVAPVRDIRTPFEGAGYVPAGFTDAEALQTAAAPYKMPQYTSQHAPVRVGGGPSTPFFGKGGMLASLGGTAQGTSQAMLSGLNTKMGVAPAGSMVSDVEAKMAKTPAGAASAQDKLLENLSLYEYKYKPQYEEVAGVPPEDRGKPRVGVMAQDLASSPAGRPAVKLTPVGMGIDRDQAIGLALGLTGRLGERIDELEKKVK